MVLKSRQPYAMPRLILFNKPYQVLSQFTDVQHRATLADYIPIPGFYVAGRLDRDSEGLLILTNHGGLQAQISHPRYKLPKTYWVQVEGVPSESALRQLRQGVVLKEGLTRPAEVQSIEAPSGLWVRDPPVRYRAMIPTTWLAITLREGRNRQIRRMTAAVGYPTLRLIRQRIGDWTVDGLAPGQWNQVDKPMP